ncbi:MAG: 30S ribosomal protein S13 [Verrucomicrobia bacterium]|nr:MAG: 30S ribosomal protein S13 [Verrucomicrobiota bacterium]
MPRLLGVDIPGKKKIEYSLRYIYGVGPARARAIVETLELDPNMRADDLTEEQINHVMAAITEKRFMVEGDLRRDIASNLKRLQAINCYRGLRHRRGLPVRGQRTSTNARTRKGARRTVGIIRKK